MIGEQERRRTALHDEHATRQGAKMVDFAGWSMPVSYPAGILEEHLHVRRSGGLFDVSHMGRFWVCGAEEDVQAYLQSVLTHDVARLSVGRAQYNLITDSDGGTVDDAYLYRIAAERYLLVVNASNTRKDFEHLDARRREGWDDRVTLEDVTDELAMLALQGPESERVLGLAMQALGVPAVALPPRRNRLAVTRIAEAEEAGAFYIARTGYTGEPVCFELFAPAHWIERLWNGLLEVEAGAVRPTGLGARNTLRLEAGLPLYGDELSAAITGLEAGLHQLAIRLIDTQADDFVGRAALLERYLGDRGRRLHRFVLEGRGRSPRGGDAVYLAGERVGVVTSATTVPYDVPGKPGETGLRRIGFALLDRAHRTGLSRGADRRFGEVITIRRARGEAEIDLGRAELVRDFATLSEDGRRVVPVLYLEAPPGEASVAHYAERAASLVRGASENHRWRQHRCVNLIPSENTPSALVRWASELDPAGRYAEHQGTRLGELYYYQGVDWIQEVEERCARELRLFFGASNVELRPISGQMANETVFEAMVRYRTFKRRKHDLRLARMTRVFNHRLALGGHLSSQPTGALYNYVYVADDGRPAVTNFPVLRDYPYAIDVEALLPLIEQQRPELLVFGKSLIIEPEPIAEVRAFVDAMHPEDRPVIHFDMAHVLGLYGPDYQQPFAEGADLITGSTHKTFFGPQRGLVLGNLDDTFSRRRFLWRFITKSAFPGATSNHHLGTLQGLLAATYEMRAFGREYQQAVHRNARAFARALAGCGLRVEGDASRGYTQTHQVLLDVGEGRGKEVALRLERNNIICNFQGLPGDKSFRHSRGLRLGVQEMVRFGMEVEDFGELAELMADCILRDAAVGDAVAALRARHQEMRFCFSELEVEQQVPSLIV